MKQHQMNIMFAGWVRVQTYQRDPDSDQGYLLGQLVQEQFPRRHLCLPVAGDGGDFILIHAGDREMTKFGLPKVSTV